MALIASQAWAKVGEKLGREVIYYLINWVWYAGVVNYLSNCLKQKKDDLEETRDQIDILIPEVYIGRFIGQS